jgi:hypothetical protein
LGSSQQQQQQGQASAAAAGVRRLLAPLLLPLLWLGGTMLRQFKMTMRKKKMTRS